MRSKVGPSLMTHILKKKKIEVQRYTEGRWSYDNELEIGFRVPQDKKH